MPVAARSRLCSRVSAWFGCICQNRYVIDPSDSQQRKRINRIVEFAVLADHRVNLKESKKKNRYLDLA